MMKLIHVFLHLLLFVICGITNAQETSSVSIPFSTELTPDVTVMIPMRDGFLLPTDLYLPHPDAIGLPCILIRSPSGREGEWKSFAKIAKSGYVVAIQSTRSILDTEGKTLPFLTDGWGKLQDGYDTVAWLNKSPYTNGKIGTWGASALGITQLLMAPTQPPGLKCQYVVFAAASLYHHGLFPGGQLLKNQSENWLGLYARDTGIISHICQRPFYNDFWKQFDTVELAERIKVPAIHVGGWYDTFLQGTLTAFTSRQEKGGEGARGQQYLVIGPWTHFWPLNQNLGDFPVPEAGKKPPFDISPQRWFDYYLKGEDNGVNTLPPIIYYVMGPFDQTPSGGNIWRTAKRWPVPAILTPFYLSPDLGLQNRTSFESILSYLHDPQNVIPTLGGRNLFLESGPKDQRPIESRDDILVFTTPPLEEEIEVTGNLTAKLFVVTDQIDTDFVVRLCDVYPDGRSLLVADGNYRLAVMCRPDMMELQKQLAHRKRWQWDPFIELKSVKPLEIDVDLSATSLVFAKGHSIRISISSSNYPRFEKNMNVGLFGANSGSFKLAKNTIYMGKRYPSHILIPIVRNGNRWLVPRNSVNPPTSHTPS